MPKDFRQPGPLYGLFKMTFRKMMNINRLAILKGKDKARVLFTEERLKIIHLLKSKKPKSIYALAKLLKRDFKNVYHDVSFLAQLGILAIEKSTTGRKEKKPSLLCDKILFEMVA